MANQPTKYRKFIVGAASAALVASAVAPIASAAEFNDTKGNTHEVAIDALSELGIISGYQDGSFQPNKTLSRSDVVKMMGKWLVSLGNSVPTDYKSNMRFTDLTADSNNELLQYAALVADHGVFQGNNGKLDPTGNITRENMALVLVRAYDAIHETDLVEKVKAEDFKRDVTDLKSAKAEAQPYIDVLDFYDITNPAAPVFNPKGTTTRGQFASFLHRTASLNEEALTLRILSVEGLNDTNQFLQIDFSRPVTTGLEPSDISIKDAKSGESYGVKAVKLAADGKSAQVELFQSYENANVLKYVTDYAVSVKANNELLTFTFNRPNFSESRITDIDVENKKFTAVDDKTGASVTIKVLKDEDFDYQAALGELVRVWYNGEKELVKYEIQSATAKYDSIEIDKVDAVKLLTEDKKYDITDDTYRNEKDSNKKFEIYIDGKKVTTDNGKIPSELVGKRYNFAKVGYDKAGDIEYVGAYSLNEFLVVDKVEDKEVVGIEGDTAGSFNAKDATIIKDGKVISLDDLKKGDVLFFSNDANDKDGFAEVYNKTVTGKITDTFYEAIRVDGKTYDFVHNAKDNDKYAKKDYAKAVYLNDKNKLEYIDEDSAEELQAAGEVSLYLDRAGNLVYVGGDTADVIKNTKTSILTEDIKTKIDFNKAVAQFETVDQDGKDKLYQVELETLKKITINGVDYTIKKNAKDAKEYEVSLAGGNNSDIVLTSGTGVKETISLKAASTVVNFKLDDSNAVKELEFFTSTSSKNGGFGTSDKTVEAKDSYVGGKKLQSSTVVFDAKKASSNGVIDEKDVKVTTWGDYKGSDIISSYYVYNEDGEVIALVIKETSAQDTVDEAALITNVLRNSDKEVVEITAFVNGSKETYKVDDVRYDNLDKGSVVVLRFDKDNKGTVDNITAASSSFVKKDLIVDSVDTGRKEVTFVDGTTARLVNSGLILNATDKTDISTKAMSDLRGENIKVTVLYDEKNSQFAKYFVYEKVSKAEYDRLKDQQTNADPAVSNVISKINALPAVADITLANETAVNEARKAYDALTTAQKDQVTKSTVDRLEAAETKIAELKAENPGEITFTTVKAESANILAQTFAGAVSYDIQGTIADAGVSEVTMTFTGKEDGPETVTATVTDGKFTFTKAEDDFFGDFNKVVVKYTVDGKEKTGETAIKVDLR
ncbi:S-layer homology domain-containing protein [Sporosarcina aquimarina]|uniref:S-layer homology domain-containing protein n=1 Tax=Sporosarcina aquimarina TaxID=114975 RepID=UPI001C8EF063|nr:S-layer homology domain-containing protein [Sporosarcina aquimarina]MBY0221095.1 S-layer homology domain-containing protein [Sporosarcina aquimarina]